MFFTNQGFKRLIKEAYKTTLRLANDGKGIIAAGTYWIMWIDRETIPKEKLAAIIEVAGMLPDKREQVWVQQEGNQMELPNHKMFEILDRAYSADKLLTDTGIILQPGAYQIHLFQDHIYTREIAAVSEKIIKIIDRAAVGRDEDDLEGPYLGRNGTLYWRTDQCVFEVMPYETKECEELIKHLEVVKIENGKAEVSEGDMQEETQET